MIQKSSLKTILNSIKGMQTTKMYEKQGKWLTANVISKEDFLKVCIEHNECALSDEVIQSIEPSICLSNRTKDFYPVKLLQGLFIAV